MQPMRMAFLGCLALAATQAAGNLIVNGGFETGDFTGWTTTTTPGLAELLPWQVGMHGSGTAFHHAMPREGMFTAMNGFDGEGTLSYELYQDVAIPTGLSATLRVHHRIQYRTLGKHATLPREFTISIQDTSGVELEQLYHHEIHFAHGGHGTPHHHNLRWELTAFDLSAYMGRTVRVHFHQYIPETFTGPALLEIDNVSLRVVPAPGAGLVLMGLAMVRRRR